MRATHCVVARRSPAFFRWRREDAQVVARDTQVGRAVWWCALSVAWAGVAGGSALIAGLVVGSVALVGFGADSVVDGSASAVLVWRLSAARTEASDADVVERRAARVVGGILVVLGVYLTVAAVVALANRSHPDRTAVGVALTAASVLVLPVLARAKLRLATQLGSSALRGDGVLSLAGAALAAATLVSLLVESAFGWWWADAVAALLIGGTLLREGSLISLGRK
jgi:divalent metal cation (Fe/Co/Zn/Cd) transporter